jgi:EPS-associated MarR family transcriptional regulator
MTPEQEAHFRLLKVLEEHPSASQRELAAAVGLSLGRTNYVLHALMEKGMLKIGRFLRADNKLSKTSYILTPAGIRERMALTQGYVQRKQTEFDALKAELDRLRQETPDAFEKSPLGPEGKQA